MSAKVAIVAGAGGALGHATAVTLAARGLTVVAVDRNEHALAELPDDVRREVADTTDPAVATQLIDRIAGEVGPPDVLVNTIGAFRLGDALSHDSRDAAAHDRRQPGTRAVAEPGGRAAYAAAGFRCHRARNRPPGIEPSGGMAAYSVSKAALVHLTRILDLELRPHGIRVNAVAPQLLDTSANRATFPAEAMAHAVAPEAIADVIAFLVSDAAAPVSGAILPAYGA